MGLAKQETAHEQLQAELKELAGKIASDLSKMDDSYAKELLSDFVSDLFLSVADQRRKEERRQKQAAGIAAAQARGVKFGRRRLPLPDNFDEFHQAWRSGELTLEAAASACGMSRPTFYSAAMRKEQAEIENHA